MHQNSISAGPRPRPRWEGLQRPRPLAGGERLAAPPQEPRPALDPSGLDPCWAVPKISLKSSATYTA